LGGVADGSSSAQDATMAASAASRSFASDFSNLNPSYFIDYYDDDVDSASAAVTAASSSDAAASAVGSQAITEKMGFGGDESYHRDVIGNHQTRQESGRSSNNQKYSYKPQQNQYDPWRDIFQEGAFKGSTEQSEYSERRGGGSYGGEARRRPPRPAPPPPRRQQQQHHRRPPPPPPPPGNNRRNDFRQTPTNERIDFFNEIYGESDDYFYVGDSHSSGNSEAIDKIDFDNYDDYVDPLDVGNAFQQPSAPPTLTERVSEVIFSPMSVTIVSILALPFILGALYWLFVVNGPTPVVKARLEDVKFENEVNQNNFVSGSADEVSYSEVYTDQTGLYQLVKPLIVKALEAYQSYTVGTTFQ